MFPFEVGSKLVLVGSASSGKTSWTMRLIKFNSEMFPDEPPEKIMICYSVFQPLYAELQKSNPSIIFKTGLPSKEEMMELGGDDENNIRHSLLVIDDLMSDVCSSKEIEQLFVTYAHHRKISCVFLTQNLFYQGKCSRTISLNSWYFILMKTRRDMKQIRQLASQIMGGSNITGFMMAYEDVMKEKYGYLLVDVSPHGQRKYMLRTNIFPDDPPTITYVIR